MAQPRTFICSLTPHPACGPSCIKKLGAEIRLKEDRIILLYRLEGDIDALLIPEKRESGRRDGLWEHTCMEAFFGRTENPSYLEYNFSPSTDWAAYAFPSYRQAGPLPHIPAPIIQTSRDGHLFLLQATLAMAVPDISSTRLCITAVLEEKSGGKTWWAIKHAFEKPDFHHTNSFTRLENFQEFPVDIP